MANQKLSRAVRELEQKNFEYKNLQREHKFLDERIEALSKRKIVTAADEKLKRELQKKKLAGRDRMEEIVRQYQAQA